MIKIGFKLSIIFVVNFASLARAEGGDIVPEWIEDGGWIILILACLAMFYGLATVVEEFFVPALNTFCTTYKIPDDVAGATFMAAAASSPEMFAAFISLFITHSALGVGTIIGSELFNHLMITAGSIYYSKGGNIQCDWRLVGRESFFYLLAMALLCWCLLETSANSDECQGYLDNAPLVGPAGDPNYGSKLADLRESGCICVYWYHPTVLVLGYLSYALTCAFYQKIMASFCPGNTKSPAALEDDWKKKKAENGFEDPGDNGLRSSHSVFSQPIENFASNAPSGVRDSRAESAAQHMENPMGAPQGMSKMSVSDTEADMYGNSERVTRARAFTTSVGTTLMQNLAPAHLAEGATADLYQVITEGPDSFSCYLWKKSQYYSKIPNHPKAWPLRWCIIDSNGFRSSRSRGLTRGTKAMDLFNAFAVDIVDEDRCLIKISAPRGSFLLQAPSADILHQLHQRLTSKMAEYKTMSTAARKAMRQASLKDPSNVDVKSFASMSETVEEGFEHATEEHDEDHEDMLAWPTSNAWVPWHLLVLPVKIMLHYTVADVRKPGDEHKYIQSMLMSVFYLALFSFIMTESMGLLGPLIGIDDIIMGIVFAAAGTSFPNVFASMVVARQGMGNAAISNALGGNVFNIFMGLGLPWIFYIIIPGQEYVDYDNYVYYGLSRGGILFPLLLLVIVLVAFIALLISTGWNLYTSHAHTAIVLYGCFLVYVLTTQLEVPALGYCEAVACLIGIAVTAVYVTGYILEDYRNLFRQVKRMSLPNVSTRSCEVQGSNGVSF